MLSNRQDMQKLAQKQIDKINLKSKLRLIEQSFKSEVTRSSYTVYLNKFAVSRFQKIY